MNCAPIDRLARFIIGLLLLAWGIAGGPFWSYGGIFLMATGTWGYCPIYWVLERYFD